MTPAAAATAPARARRRVVALAGRPNTGKTTLFNALTGLRQRTANYAGCTVEKAVGTLAVDGREIEVVDLPGTFSLLPSTEDERVAFHFLSQAAAAGDDLLVLCVVEASNLANDLSLAAGLIEAGYPAAVAVNMIDEARQNGVSVDTAALGRTLRVPVLAVSARHGEGLPELRELLAGHGRAAAAPRDLSREAKHALQERQMRAVERAHEACAASVRLPRRALLPTIARSIRLDRVFLHPVAGPLLLLATMFALFQALFAGAQPLMDGLTGGLDAAAAALRAALPPGLFASLVCDGVVPGVAAVFVFVPQIAILFTLIGFLEQSGYLPRAAALVDRALRPFGLDGRVFIPFLSGFACAIPGVMAARTIPSEKRRIVAVMLTPLMTCSARLPVYTLLISAFVPASFRPWGFNGQGVAMTGLYLFAVVCALALALVLKNTPLYEKDPMPAALLPPYRLPQPKELARYVGTRCWHFLSRAGQVIFVVSIALWLLAAFPRRAPVAGESAAVAAAAQVEQSALGRAGRLIEPVFRPLGWDWRLSVASLSALAAREVFVGTLGTLYALEGSPEDGGLAAALRDAREPDGSPRYTLATALGLLMFFAVALQCISTIATVRRELGSWRWALGQFAAYFALAYALAFAAYRVAS
ncbi:MAG: ferrous iron transporter B [Elusimicrobiota bacterium]|nr:ferrous iron transporter B [Elusimicrobiota bacterium]